MIETLNAILPYITGLWTLPWILIGFIVTLLLSRIFGESNVDKVMKKIGLLLLYIFVPLLLFRIFLDVDFGENELLFSVFCFVTLGLMYVLAYLFAKLNANKMNLKGATKRHFIKTVLANQGRSSAFIGGAMLAISEWQIPAAIYMSIGAIFLFAIIPYILSHAHKRDRTSKDHALPWYLILFPWYLLAFAATSVIFHGTTGIYLEDFGDAGIVFKFFTAITIPAALYYVGAGIHPHDLKLNEMKKLFSLKHKRRDHWPWVRNIFFLTTIVTPLLTALFFSIFLVMDFIPKEWFAVLVINSILPITSTNMFLIPYGIDKKVTALSVTWTTIVCVPIVVLLITIFRTCPI
ncbi:MAG: hypothetical protein KAW47_00365 [Thermoplasmatales archaeon]|nr:hypothetical protein [Thermoplasmatales archaeon]